MRRATGPWRTASSLAVESAGATLLFDASPDLRAQQHLLLTDPAHDSDADEPFAAVFLTHAHMGHYTGLVHFGREALASAGTPLYATPTMVEFLRANQPWASLLDDGYLLAEAVEAGETATVAGLGVTPVRVPHRGEHTDTVAWSIAGDWSLLYLPDIDDWGAWPAAAEILGRHDVCLLDGTFFDDDELTGRSQDDVRHPTVRDTVRRWPDLPSTRRVVLTHLNNTNPIADPQSPEAMWTKDSGFEIADDGMLLTG